ncbi:MAG: ABC transporter permease [Planctomycetota bacterium]
MNKYWLSVRLEISRVMEYRWNFLLRLGVNSLIPLTIKIYLFNAFFTLTGKLTAGGYDKDSMLAYQLWGAVVITLVEIRSTVENVSADIRLGRITRYLLYPISMFEVTSCQWVGSLLVQTLCAVVAIPVIVMIWPEFPLHWETPAFWLGLGYALLGSLFWFLIHFTIGLTSFWLDEIWTLFVMFQFTARFASGNPFPLTWFPPWFQDLSPFLPTHWMFFAPVQLLASGTMQTADLAGLLIMPLWCLGLVIVHRKIWNRGVRMYSASGM